MICIIKKLIVCDINLVSSALYAIPSRNMVSYIANMVHQVHRIIINNH